MASEADSVEIDLTEFFHCAKTIIQSMFSNKITSYEVEEIEDRNLQELLLDNPIFWDFVDSQTNDNIVLIATAINNLTPQQILEYLQIRVKIEVQLQLTSHDVIHMLGLYIVKLCKFIISYAGTRTCLRVC